jgi:CHASE3 domain sensor protein
VEVSDLHRLAERKSSESRGFLLTRDNKFLATTQDARTRFLQISDNLKRTIRGGAEGERQIDAIIRSEAAHQRAMEAVYTLRRGSATIAEVVQAFDDQVIPLRDELEQDIAALVSSQGQALRAATAMSTAAAVSAERLVTTISILLVLGAVAIAAILSRLLGRQIGTVVGHVQSSSSELQAAANQQATGAKQQASAMTEISTTINELLVTSRQITESAQRVAQIAEDTARSAAGGERTVGETQESMTATRRQMDLIVSHMLDLGRKSQHIGAVLDIVSELAEQTNILAINATIEAAGAGDAGRRFAIVADEIRKLADRVTGSTKEIRDLIDDVRVSVNTTVMATETGSKAVDAGGKQFDQVAASFRQIAGMVGTTMEAAREIELSTKQQMTAVEQVNVAIANIAQASRETEASSSQTLQTASQLAGLSKDLLRLVKPQMAA